MIGLTIGDSAGVGMILYSATRYWMAISVLLVTLGIVCVRRVSRGFNQQVDQGSTDCQPSSARLADSEKQSSAREYRSIIAATYVSTSDGGRRIQYTHTQRAENVQVKYHCDETGSWSELYRQQQFYQVSRYVTHNRRQRLGTDDRLLLR
jgi:hypothetical protein